VTNNETAVDRQEFEIAPKLANKKGFTNRDRLIDNELGLLHERELINDIYKTLKTLFHTVIIPTIIKCPVYARRNIFKYDNRHRKLERVRYLKSHKNLKTFYIF
jgi:hypothetical protein